MRLIPVLLLTEGFNAENGVVKDRASIDFEKRSDWSSKWLKDANTE